MLQVQRKRSFGYGGTQSNCFPLNFKRPKVDAVRDFPPDCGTFSPGITSSSSKAGSGEAASLISEVQMVDATRKLPTVCRPLPTGVTARWTPASFQTSQAPRVEEIRQLPGDCGSFPTQVSESPRKALLDEAANGMSKEQEDVGDDTTSFQTSQAPRVEEIRQLPGDCGSFPTQVSESPRKALLDEAANGMSKEQEDALVPEVIYPVNSNSAKHVLQRDKASPFHHKMDVGDDGNVPFKTHVKPKLDNKEPDIMKTIGRTHPAQLYPPPKIRKRYSAVRDFPPGCGRLARASRSNNKPEDHVKCTETELQILPGLKLVQDGVERRSLSHSEEKVTQDSAKQAAVSKEEVHEQLFDESDPEEEETTGIHVQGSSDLDVVPDGVDRCTLSPSQKKRSPHSSPPHVNVNVKDNFAGKRKKKQLQTNAFKPAYQKQTSFTKPGEDAGRLIISEDNTADRHKVREALNQFRVIFEKLTDEPEPRLKENIKTVKRIHLETAIILKNQKRWVNTTRLLGHIPGIEVGDQFRFRAELFVVGLHRQFQAGIDYMTKGGDIFATSIVDSGRYANEAASPDVLVYSGAGGNPSIATNKKAEDQKLERGNIALKNSLDSQMPVRVIRGRQTQKSSNNREWTPMYMYDGLYNVASYKQEIGKYGKIVFMFKLHRLPGQPKINWRKANVSKMSKVSKRGSIVVDDISQGKEKMPIRVLNTLDNEKPSPFHYITKLLCLKPGNRSMPSGCNCTDGCSETKSCFCTLKNGGKIPFGDNGALISGKPLVYECGPSCKCPPSCKNRVSQHGIRYHQLEVFKTKTMGWGVRSRNYISAGTFICEYVGELLQDKQAERRKYDDYLFDVGSGCGNPSDDNGYTIDAAHFGNLGRFLNHSCSPNLYAVNVLYDHHNVMFPHVMFFAANNIAPLRELTFDYNYKVDSIHDEDGNIRKKNCYCGSTQCRGRMY